MGIENACYACQSRRYGKCQQLILCNIDSYRLSRNPIVTDRHDRPSGPGIDDIQNNKQRNQHQNHANGKGGCLGSACDPLSTLDQHLSVRCQPQRKGVL